MPDAVQSRWKIALHLFTFQLPHSGNNFSCSLTFRFGRTTEGREKYLTLPFLAIFAYLSVSAIGHPHDEKHFLAAKPEKVV